MDTKTHSQMLTAIRWLHFKAALLHTVGLLFVSCAVLPLALMAYGKDAKSGWVVVLGLVLLALITTALYSLTKGVMGAYSYGAKSEEFIRRFYAALVETGDIRH